MKRKIGPYSILKKCGPNAYEVQLPNGLGLSPTFNVCDLTPYKGSDVGAVGDEDLEQQTEVNFPKHEPPTLEKVLDTRVVKKTRKKEHKQYLFKWKGQPDNEAVWMDEQQIQTYCTTLEQLISSGLEISCLWEYDVGVYSNPKQGTIEEEKI